MAGLVPAIQDLLPPVRNTWSSGMRERSDAVLQASKLRHDDCQVSRLLSRLRGAAMGLGPAGRVLHEFLGLVQPPFVEAAALLRRCEHVPPSGERMQCDAEIAQDFS